MFRLKTVKLEAIVVLNIVIRWRFAVAARTVDVRCKVVVVLEDENAGLSVGFPWASNSKRYIRH